MEYLINGKAMTGEAADLLYKKLRAVINIKSVIHKFMMPAHTTLADLLPSINNKAAKNFYADGILSESAIKKIIPDLGITSFSPDEVVDDLDSCVLETVKKFLRDHDDTLEDGDTTVPYEAFCHVSMSKALDWEEDISKMPLGEKLIMLITADVKDLFDFWGMAADIGNYFGTRPHWIIDNNNLFTFIKKHGL